MTTIGSSDYGIILCDAITAADEPDITSTVVYLAAPSVTTTYKTMDKISHFMMNISLSIVLGKNYQVATVSNATIYANTIAELNSYVEQIITWAGGTTGIYMFVKDRSGTYLQFRKIATTSTFVPYIKGRLRNPRFTVSHNKKTISFSIEESN